MGEYISYYKSPIGLIQIKANNEFLLSTRFVNNKKCGNENDLTKLAKKQLKEYFNYKRKKFNLPIKLKGTDFQNKVWKELQNVPFGKKSTYKKISLKINKPKAYRAVGNANKRNEFLIIIPCHRIISSNGKLGGYSCGIEKKKWLLKHERKFMKNKLIIIEGMPGSGKTTTAKTINQKLLSKKIENKLYLEGNLDNPSDYESTAVFNKESYNKLINDYNNLCEIINKYSKKENEKYLINYGKLLKNEIDIDKNLKNRLFSNDVYNLPLKEFKNICKSKWQNFSVNSEINKRYILECCFLQNPTTTMLAYHNSSKEKIEKYISDIEKIISKLNPIVVYLNKKNLNKSFNKIKKERSKEWYNFVLDYITNQEYGNQNDLEGYEGLLEFYKNLNQLQLKILSKLSIKNIVIDDPHKDWKKTYKKILDNIE